MPHLPGTLQACNRHCTGIALPFNTENFLIMEFLSQHFMIDGHNRYWSLVLRPQDVRVRKSQ